MRVPLHFINADLSPGVKASGGTINHVMTELDVMCLPDDLPNYIEVDLSNLELGHSIHISNLQLPQGVVSTQLRGGDDAVVATVVVPKAEVEPEVEAVAAADAAAAAAPAGEPSAEAKEGEKKPGDREGKEKDKDKDKDKK
jgi:large subunit ribosomal protein L25